MSPNIDGARYTAATRKVQTSKPRKAWRTRTKVRIKWTSEQKAALRAKRAQHPINYGTALKEAREVVQHQAEMLYEKFGKHSIEYYYQEVMQKSHLVTQKRSVNHWNAFLSGKLKEHNEEREKQGLSKEKVDVIVVEVSAQWKCMNKEERSDATDNLMQSLGDQREMKDLALYNVPLNAFQDGRKTLDSIDHELSALNARTGMEILLFAVRSDVEHFNQPHIFQTSCTSAFFDACLGTSVGNIALHLEGFSIAGVQKETAVSVKISRMYYVNFNDNIISKHHIVLKNWPLSKFCCPGDISSLNELKVLFYAFDTGVGIHFRLGL
ncbi:uncharacterized protein F5891DRAFT_956561 [Suillus fuscotomentosus]|uniref:Uncharacterized protein n=1 Tax=Suillus fuscotomentosus TaxID=1912939 RepID=A0AAD4E249_9AGAM|nr:uncharacterized protein F5891DRAFT_956561 [Suillus fuscotomentosus]KAG1897856.1 hypothetical protein F5891DRAFT_956561 [Suillus fuscotomentosus]